MSLSQVLSLPARYKPWKPLHMRLVMRDLLNKGGEPEQAHEVHLQGAIDWLCHAQDIRKGCEDEGGVSAGWSFEDGWLRSYPETTGYIIETFLAAAKLLGKPELVDRAQRMIDWELSIQQADGAFPGHFGEPGSRPVIFNTGQIMHGMIAGYLQLNRKECLEAAVRGGHWLARVQDGDGAWRKFEHNDIPHVYNTRATWALASTAVISGDATLKAAAVRNLDWAMSQQTPSGWWKTNVFKLGQLPFTHNLAYAMRGLLESGILLGEERYIAAALKAGQGIAARQHADGWIAGTFDDDWQPGTTSYSCLTGVAQLAINWQRLAQTCGAEKLREHARLGIRYLKRHHSLADPDPVVRGGIAGSAPIWGTYSRFEYPNWAAKFFADALMIDLTNQPLPPVPAQAAGGGRP